MPLRTAPDAAARRTRWVATAQNLRRARRAAWKAAAGDRTRYAEIMRQASARTPER